MFTIKMHIKECFLSYNFNLLIKMKHLEQVQEMYNMINQGQALEAFEKFYSEDVVMIEATGQVREGKETNRQFEQEFFASIQEFHGSGVESVSANEENGTTAVECWMEVTFKDGNRVKMEQVAVQKWQNGQIVKEKFYYNPNHEMAEAK